MSRSEGGGEMSRCSDPFSKYLHGSGGAAGVGGENIYQSSIERVHVRACATGVGGESSIY